MIQNWKVRLFIKKKFPDKGNEIFLAFSNWWLSSWTRRERSVISTSKTPKLFSLSLIIPNVVSWWCSFKLKKGLETFYTPTMIHNLYECHCNKKVTETLLPAVLSLPPLTFVATEKVFLWKFNFLFDYFFAKNFRRRFSEKCFNLWKQEISLPVFFHESCSLKQKLNLLSLVLMMHVFQFAFYKRKKDGEEKQENFWSNRRKKKFSRFQ